MVISHYLLSMLNIDGGFHAGFLKHQQYAFYLDKSETPGASKLILTFPSESDQQIFPENTQTIE